MGVLAERLGGWRDKAVYMCAHAHKHSHCCGKTSGFRYVAQNAHMSLYSANSVFTLTGFKREKKTITISNSTLTLMKNMKETFSSKYHEQWFSLLAK